MYEVVYRRRGNELEDLAVNSTDMGITIEGLDINADYVFQLRAYTSRGSGPWSNRLPFRTFGNRQFLKQFCVYIVTELLTELFTKCCSLLERVSISGT